MLEELEIRNLGSISHALFTPSHSMTAITGETGAGKSMLLSAISLISGGKAQLSRIAANADESWVQGVFCTYKDSSLANLLQSSGIYLEESDTNNSKLDVYVSRSVPKNGRSRATVSGKGVPKTLLSQISSYAITIHGQSDQLRIASKANQRDFLDIIANDSAELKEYYNAFQDWKSAKESYNRITNQESSVRQRADYLRESLEKIDHIDPKPNEDIDLIEKRNRIENAAQIIRGVSDAVSSIDASQIDYSSDSIDILHLIDNAIKALRSIRVEGLYDDILNQLDDISAQLSDIVMQLTQQLDIDESQEDLDSINARIHDLNELTRRWGPKIEDVLEWSKKARYELEDLDDSPEAIKRAKELCNEKYCDALRLAKILTEKRVDAARKLSDDVTEELKSLAMQDALLIVKVVENEKDGSGDIRLDSHGADSIEFLFKPFPASSDLPIASSASGGELSRLMLAMELVAARCRRNDNHEMTFIFDEVDAGVGGVAALELGKRLAQLAKSCQVIVVTHLAQVASFADTQYVVRKTIEHKDNSLDQNDSAADSAAASDSDSSTLLADTTITKLGYEDRVLEIARMLSGSDSKASLQHARELLENSKI